MKYSERECPTCGIPFCVSEKFISVKAKTGESFYCPNGHSMHFPDAEIAKLKKDLVDVIETLAKTKHELDERKALDH